MSVTVYPPAASSADPITHADGAKWTPGTMGSLEIHNGIGEVIAEHAGGQWGYVTLEAPAP